MGNVTQASGAGAAGQKYALTSDDDDSDVWGSAHEAEGLFTPLPDDEDESRAHLTRRLSTDDGEVTLFELILTIFERRGASVVLR